MIMPERDGVSTGRLPVGRSCFATIQTCESAFAETAEHSSFARLPAPAYAYLPNAQHGLQPRRRCGNVALPKGRAAIGAAVLLLLLTVPTAWGQCFSSSTFSVGREPLSLAIGDVNGDGHQDLVVVNETDDDITVLLGNGDGTFLPSAAGDVPAGRRPSFVALGDLDVDGDLDMAVADRAGNAALALLGDGSGGFPTSQPTPAGAGPVSVAIGSLNPSEDTNPDLAVTNIGEGKVSVLLGMGDGTFSEERPRVPVGNRPVFVAIGSLNSDDDAFPDLAVVNRIDRNVSILLNNGDGTFFTAAGSPVPVGISPRAVAIGDLNGDGILDLAVPNADVADSDGNVSILIGNGSGGFTATPPVMNVGRNPVFVAIGDLNSDGNADLAVADFGTCSMSSDVFILHGNGDGSFDPEQEQAVMVEKEPLFIVIGDFDEDSRPDLAVLNKCSKNVSILLNRGVLDCNGNGVPDDQDIDPADPDGNGQVSPDCNGNGIPDECDVAGGASADVVGSGGLPDGVPDECQTDCNQNLIPDDLDIANGPSQDCNLNTIPDECEIDVNSTAPGGPFFCVSGCDPDCNNNGIPDACDAGGESQLATWTGAGDGTNWSNANNWCPAVVPDNGANGQFSVQVQIGAGNAVTLDTDATISSLDLDPNSSIDMNAGVGKMLVVTEDDRLTNRGAIRIRNNGNTATAGGMITNSGNINIAADQGTASLVPSTMPTMLTGGGTVRLSNPVTSILGSVGSNVSLTNDAGHTVCGAGEVFGNFTNNGMVLADSANNALTLSGVNTQRVNNSTMTAANGGMLRIAGNLNQGVNGSMAISTPGSMIELGVPMMETAKITGGTIDQCDGCIGQVILQNSSKLKDLTIVGGLTVPPTQMGFFEGAITNQGTILADGDGGHGSVIATLDAPVSFQGNGSIVLKSQSQGASSSLQSTPPTTITNGVNHTIEGVGSISAALVNNGLVRARRPSGAFYQVLSLDGTLSFTNAAQGTMSADEFAMLDINRPLTNDGQISASTDGTVNVNADIWGNGALVASGGTINNNHFTNAGCVDVLPGSVSHVFVSGSTGRLDATDLRVTGGIVTVESGASATFSAGAIVEPDPNEPNAVAQVVIDAGGSMTVTGTYQQNGGQTEVNGTLTVNAQPPSPPPLVLAGGTLSGSGTVDADITVGAGIVAPGRLSPGSPIASLTIMGTYTQQAGTLEIDLGGTPLSGNNDKLVVTGAASLAGGLRVQLQNGFVPSLGDEFVILTTTQVTGTLSAPAGDLPPLAAGLEWDLRSESQRLVLAVVAVCVGDLNGDNVVDLADLSVLLGHFGTASGATPADGDLDGDGDVDLTDLSVLLSRFGSAC